MSTDKASVRLEAKCIRNELSYRREKDCKIAQNVVKLLSGVVYDSVFAYVSMGSEADTRRLVSLLQAAGARIYVPFTRGKVMYPVPFEGDIFSAVPDKLGNVFVGAEPTEAAPTVTLVPMLAFDAEGYRLGYGGGYYDRYLAAAHTLSIGLAYDEQQLSFDREAHDVRPSCIVTPTRVIGRI